MDAAVVAEVLGRLRDFESMTWLEIDGPTGSHGVALHRLSKHAQQRLTDIRQDDAAELFSLRITGKRRVWGVLDEHVLRISGGIPSTRSAHRPGSTPESRPFDG